MAGLVASLSAADTTNRSRAVSVLGAAAMLRTAIGAPLPATVRAAVAQDAAVLPATVGAAAFAPA